MWLKYGTYGKDFEKFTTFRFHGHTTRYYIHDPEEMFDKTSKLHGQKRRRIFLFFWLMCSKQPLRQRSTFTVGELVKIGELV